METFAQAWGRSIGVARSFGRKNPSRYLEIQSQDIVFDPAPVVLELLNYADVSASSETIQKCADAAWDTSPLDIEHEIWQVTFDDDARRLFRRHAGELLKLLDFE